MDARARVCVPARSCHGLHDVSARCHRESGRQRRTAGERASTQGGLNSHRTCDVKTLLGNATHNSDKLALMRHCAAERCVMHSTPQDCSGMGVCAEGGKIHIECHHLPRPAIIASACDMSLRLRLNDVLRLVGFKRLLVATSTTHVFLLSPSRVLLVCSPSPGLLGRFLLHGRLPAFTRCPWLCTVTPGAKACESARVRHLILDQARLARGPRQVSTLRSMRQFIVDPAARLACMPQR